jgi:hypothetical protein
VSVTRRVLTLHAPVKPAVADELLTAIEGALLRAGAERVRIDPTSGYDLVVLADMPAHATGVVEAAVALGASDAGDPVPC